MSLMGVWQHEATWNTVARVVACKRLSVLHFVLQAKVFAVCCAGSELAAI